MPELNWLGDHDAKRTARRVPYRLRQPVSVVGGPSSDNLMMYPRLELLRDLLSEDGSIWVSIDDNEGHYLKVLLDELFGRLNFAATFIWQKVDSPNDNKPAITPDHEFVLCYEKKRESAGFRKKSDTTLLDAYAGQDDQGRWFRDSLLKKNGKNSLREDRATGKERGLEGVNLFDRKCTIEFVITVEALKEGWDCSFAYVFCTLQKVRSNRDMEQRRRTIPGSPSWNS
jgi:hypothetical protein